jgi:hypothetical protein
MRPYFYFEVCNATNGLYLGQRCDHMYILRSTMRPYCHLKVYDVTLDVKINNLSINNI